MKIRHPALVKTAGFLGASLIRGWMGSLRFRHHALGGPDVNPYSKGQQRRFIYAIWHENCLFPAYYFRNANIAYLISRHADGQVLAEIAHRLGVPLVRGSTRRGGAEALRGLIRTMERYHVAIATDGPRGPRRQAQIGMIYLAARTGFAIVPSGIGYQRPWRLSSWDRMALPRPGTVATFVSAPPIEVPADLDRAGWERYLRFFQEQMDLVTGLAEDWANSGSLHLGRAAA
jgi:lysophospholipid acyltransferase (LPLAT)-like uncharacterized protein